MVNTDAEEGESGWLELLEQSSHAYTTCYTLAEDPCWIIYISGTTGPPKGTLHAHRALLGHMSG